MPKNLKTDWLTIGRSGPTVDGREIKPEWLVDAAETYNPGIFAARIWPEHQRFIVLGSVTAVRTAANDEGGLDLQAVLSPNQFYLDSNELGQRLYTSMELTPDFRKTGRYYLTGLGATDQPASVATSEVRFSHLAGDAVRGDLLPLQFTQTTPHRGGLWSRLFGGSIDDSEDLMQLAYISEQLAAMRQDLTALRTDITATAIAAPAAAPAPEAVVELTARVDALTAKFEALPNPQNYDAQLAALNDRIESLSATLAAALTEPAPSTPTPPAPGALGSLADFI